MSVGEKIVVVGFGLGYPLAEWNCNNDENTPGRRVPGNANEPHTPQPSLVFSMRRRPRMAVPPKFVDLASVKEVQHMSKVAASAD